MAAGEGVRCAWTMRDARTEAPATSDPTPATGAGVPPSCGTLKIRPPRSKPFDVENNTSAESAVQAGALQWSYFANVS
jgi:hypothetical protein